MKLRVVLMLMVVALPLTVCRTLPLNEEKKRATTVNGDAASSGVHVDPSRRNAGCFVYKREDWIVTNYYLDKETRRRIAKNESLTRIVRQCCKGYTGHECDQRMDVTETITCGNMTCDADPNAYCARVKKCGKEISIFLDENGVPSKKCNHTYDLESISCNGVCREDPCLNAECPGYPSATCFPMGCECKAVWLIHNPYTRENLEVVCGSEGSRNNRQRRQSSCNS